MCIFYHPLHPLLQVLPSFFFTISNKNFEKEKDTTSSLVVIKVYAFVFVGPCLYMQRFAWPFDINGPVYYVSSLRYLSVVVFGLPLLRLSFILSLTCPSPQTWVTHLHQMAFCLAELHLWSTKGSLQVKGTTYQHVQSPSPLLDSLLSSFSLCLVLALSVITHFVDATSKYLDLLLQSDFHFTSFLNVSVCTFS